jgi:hypothetical protein
MLPIRITTPAIRAPDGSAVQTAIPSRKSSTAIGPFGVAMRVPRARQIGHGGGPLGVCDVTAIWPRPSTVPSTSDPVFWSGVKRAVK